MSALGDVINERLVKLSLEGVTRASVIEIRIREECV